MRWSHPKQPEKESGEAFTAGAQPVEGVEPREASLGDRALSVLGVVLVDPPVPALTLPGLAGLWSSEVDPEQQQE